MKILIPTDNETKETRIAESLGRAQYYMLYDTDSKTSETFSNPAKDSPSGAGVKAAQTIVDAGAQVLITIRCGDRAYEVLNNAGMRVMAAFAGTAEENIDAYLSGRMPELGAVCKVHDHGAQ